MDPKYRGKVEQKMGQMVPDGKTGGAEGKGDVESNRKPKKARNPLNQPRPAVFVWLPLRSLIPGLDERPDLLPVAFGQVNLRMAA